MITTFYILLALFIFCNTLRVLLCLLFFKKHDRQQELTEQEEAELSIIQPILSGDIKLKETLHKNVINSKTAHFIWLVDSDDIQAQNITTDIINQNHEYKSRIQVIIVDNIPPEANPKVYKLSIAMPHARKYAVILDDDTTINIKKVHIAHNILQQREALVSGIPFYQSSGIFYDRLVASFVNANSIFIYLPISTIIKSRTINGMFYVSKSETLLKLNAFKKVENALCDDYEIAKLIRKNNIPIIQSVMPCQVSTSVKNFSCYQRLMKRWFVFTNRYLKENMNLATILIVIIPAFTPMVLLIISTILGIEFLLMYLAIHIFKTILQWIVRKKTLKTDERFLSIVYELLIDYLQVFHYIHSLLDSHQIVWRKHSVKLSNDKIHFE